MRSLIFITQLNHNFGPPLRQTLPLQSTCGPLAELAPLIYKPANSHYSYLVEPEKVEESTRFAQRRRAAELCTPSGPSQQYSWLSVTWEWDEKERASRRRIRAQLHRVILGRFKIGPALDVFVSANQVDCEKSVVTTENGKCCMGTCKPWSCAMGT